MMKEAFRPVMISSLHSDWNATENYYHIYSRAMKTQHPNVHQYLNDILNLLKQKTSDVSMNTKDRHYIDFIRFNMKCPNVYTHAHFPTTVK